MLKFEENFLKREVREGFEIEPLMKCVWAEQIEVLSNILRVCNELDIKVFADWGTLLGAVRHKGYIPWDDDVDISMLREDYDKFCKYAASYLPEEYFVYANRFDGKSFIAFTRVVNSRRISFEKEYLERKHNCPIVVGVDIFPVDNIPNNKEEDELRCEILNIIIDLLVYENIEDREVDMLVKLENLLGIEINREADIKEQLLNLYDQLVQIYNDDDSQYVSTIAFHAKKRAYLPKKAFGDIIYMDFENIKIPVPAGYDEVLRERYGDYITPKKIEGGHDYPFYKDQIAAIRENGLGGELDDLLKKLEEA